MTEAMAGKPVEEFPEPSEYGWSSGYTEPDRDRDLPRPDYTAPPADPGWDGPESDPVLPPTDEPPTDELPDDLGRSGGPPEETAPPETDEPDQPSIQQDDLQDTRPQDGRDRQPAA
jgi:hypothetical protein